MRKPPTISEHQAIEYAEILIPKYKHTKLARSAAEFMVSECFVADMGDVMLGRNVNFDIGTLRAFVDFLITKRGYN